MTALDETNPSSVDVDGEEGRATHGDAHLS
jgi:hypothetical protein